MEPRLVLPISELPPEQRRVRAVVERLSQLVDGRISTSRLRDLLLNGLLYRQSSYYEEGPDDGDEDSDPSDASGSDDVVESFEKG